MSEFNAKTESKPVAIPPKGGRAMWTTAQLAAATQNDPLVICRKCRLKKIQAVKNGNDWRIPAAIADAIVDGKVAI